MDFFNLLASKLTGSKIFGVSSFLYQAKMLTQSSASDILYKYFGVNKEEYKYVLAYITTSGYARVWFFNNYSTSKITYSGDMQMFTPEDDIDINSMPEHTDYSAVATYLTTSLNTTIYSGKSNGGTGFSSGHTIWTNAENFTGGGYPTVYHIT
jgi:hypothetical protein